MPDQPYEQAAQEEDAVIAKAVLEMRKPLGRRVSWHKTCWRVKEERYCHPAEIARKQIHASKDAQADGHEEAADNVLVASVQLPLQGNPLRGRLLVGGLHEHQRDEKLDRFQAAATAGGDNNSQRGNAENEPERVPHIEVGYLLHEQGD